MPDSTPTPTPTPTSRARATSRLRLSVDFEARRLEGTAALELGAPSGGALDLDTKGLEILGVSTGTGAPVPFELGAEEPILGRRLRLALPAGTREVRIRYRTSPDAPALQWLAPEQTAGRRHPFLFSQCQAIHARSLAPLPDTPAEPAHLRGRGDGARAARRRDVGRPRRRAAGPRPGTRGLPLRRCRSRSRPTCSRSRWGPASRATSARARASGPSRRRSRRPRTSSRRRRR